jgi:protein arginine kinase
VSDLAFTIRSIDELMSGARYPNCPICGTSEEEARENVKAGCPHCYEHFAHVFDPHIERIHSVKMPPAAEAHAEMLRDYPEYLDIAVSSRVRLARNATDFPFPGAMNSEQELLLFENLRGYLTQVGSGRLFEVVDLDSFKHSSIFGPASLLEKHLISKELLGKEGSKRGAAISPAQDISIMINEEDHLRIQAMGEGLSLLSCLEKAEAAEKLLSENVTFAKSDKLGIITRCPTNLGTGLRASVMVHLPAHTDSGQINGLAVDLGKSGYTIRGFYGEGTKALGRLYQVSNQQTTGLEIRQIVENLNALVLKIIIREREIQRLLDSNHPGYIEDQVHRAYGLLTHARRITGDEAMQLLSLARVGVSIGQLDIRLNNLNGLIHSIQPNTLCLAAGRKLGDNERDHIRAALIRNTLEQLTDNK